MESVVSVIVPVYNAQDFLDRCIDSLVSQTYKNIEIILIDDGSMDKCPQICDTWAQKDSRIKVIHKKNGGAGNARNCGIDNASGEYVCFIDSDDYIDVTTIEKCVLSIESSCADAAVYGSLSIDGSGKTENAVICDKRVFFDEFTTRQVLLPSFFSDVIGYECGVWGKMYRLKIINDNGIRFESEREFYSEDALFLLEYFSKCKSVAAIPEHLYYYYENNNSLSRTYSKDRENTLDAFLLKALAISEKENLGKKIKAHIMARYHACAMVEYKNIVLSDYRFKEKMAILKTSYQNPVLQRTLKKEVFAVEMRTLSLFYGLIKRKKFFISYLLLWYRVHK